MAAKRTATSDLNHENWEHEDEPEEMGTFQRASEESIKNRVIRTAKRRNPISSVRQTPEDGEKKSAFTGFTFSKTSTSSTPSGQFSFLSNLEQPKTNGIPGKNDTASSSVSSTILGNRDSKDEGQSDTYFSKLKGLNESVSKWIKQHVDANPLINLQPIFRDYEKYFKELEVEETKNSTKDNKTETTNKKDTVPSMGTFQFTSVQNVPDSTTEKSQTKETNSKDSPKFSFGTLPAATSVSATKPSFFSSTATSNTFSFASSSASATSTSASFSFGKSMSSPTAFSLPTTAATSLFTFGAPSKPAPSSETKADDQEKKDDEEEDEPPKVEFKPVEEKGHIFTARCKVFVKKEDGFADRGVGNLYLKPIDGSEKVQLIVRADTNLGNLLCNFILSKNIPTERKGKKDVMLVCVPTPDFKPPPVPILLRATSTEEADKILETLEKNKK